LRVALPDRRLPERHQPGPDSHSGLARERMPGTTPQLRALQVFLTSIFSTHIPRPAPQCIIESERHLNASSARPLLRNENGRLRRPSRYSAWERSAVSVGAHRNSPRVNPPDLHNPARFTSAENIGDDVGGGRPSRGNVAGVACDGLRLERSDTRAWLTERANTHSDRLKKPAISPTMPRRKTSTQTTKMAPWITVTHWPRYWPRYCCIVTTRNAPTTGP
jgi:hypothetical protein